MAKKKYKFSSASSLMSLTNQPLRLLVFYLDKSQNIYMLRVKNCRSATMKPKTVQNFEVIFSTHRLYP
jgi:hypothetical protein